MHFSITVSPFLKRKTRQGSKSNWQGGYGEVICTRRFLDISDVYNFMYTSVDREDQLRFLQVLILYILAA